MPGIMQLDLMQLEKGSVCFTSHVFDVAIMQNDFQFQNRIDKN